MKPFDQIVVLLGDGLSFYKEEESHYKYKEIYQGIISRCPVFSELTNLVREFSGRDSISLLVTPKHGAELRIDLSDLDSKKVGLFTVQCGLLIDESEEVKLEIVIDKKVEGKHLSVYSPSALCDFWESRSPAQLLLCFEEINNEVSNLNVWGLESRYYSKSLCLAPYNDFEDFFPDIDLKSLSITQKKICNVSGLKEINIAPDAFVFRNWSGLPGRFKMLFQRMQRLLSLLYLCDQSNAEEEGGSISFKLTGYKTISCKVNSQKDVDISSDDFLEIYSWVYSDGNVIDKIGLARNIISLHVMAGNLLDLREGALASIRSGYDIYLKENVDRYIETKNKLSEFIMQSSEKATDICRSAQSYYKNSMWPMYTFFVSVFLLRAINGQNDVFKVNDGMLIIFLFFSVVSLAVRAHALNEMRSELERLKKSYFLLKQRYSDVLDASDMKRILNYDKDHDEDVGYIERRAKDFYFIWGLSVALMLYLVFFLWMISADL